MSKSNTRNFKKLEVNINEAAETKLANDAARTLEVIYKAKIAEFVEAKNNMAALANKNVMLFNVEEMAANNHEVKKILQPLNAYLSTGHL